MHKNKVRETRFFMGDFPSYHNFLDKIVALKSWLDKEFDESINPMLYCELPPSFKSLVVLFQFHGIEQPIPPEQ